MKCRIVEFEPGWFRGEKFLPHQSQNQWEAIPASTTRDAESTEQWLRKNHVPENYEPKIIKELEI